ncbi:MULTISPECIES: hypothetical protein [Francisella]|uniref:Uncharacterized protein n=1 Tax=Francisella opportunistica TaxID=2016517 RepID=A0A345JSL6_9GAMM|nr:MULTISPECIES: hypothetical protein [Francisella]APC92082.1 hypothetical protein BBG19_1354 [Francisella sp. MA067296]AXH30312.1 hypothetical protein CGC43_06830 [Francisella opportunistica]AXH31953.1 hypothetical protein CGC44_06810 [Francisella opportunistica]AXH33599.1 hypothetical protein CGC45_06825 [Francisella opportunistica]
MDKKFFTICLVSLTMASCTLKEDVEDNIVHYEKLTRYSMIKQVDFSKHTNDIEGVRFLVANYPDQIIRLNGVNFDNRYNKLVTYLKTNGYAIMVNEKLPLTATIIAEVNKPLPDVRYVGIIMEQDSRMDQTIYNISYGGNEFKARQLYTDYKKTL